MCVSSESEGRVGRAGGAGQAGAEVWPERVEVGRSVAAARAKFVLIVLAPAENAKSGSE